ncbi:DUF2782 domain-containing protein [Dyella japonica]|uniref:DUF2782 domain-containing protein n=1 Tax=Dyella japonica TaxID=231455 RepID=A0ABV2JX44_9GAMM
MKPLALLAVLGVAVASNALAQSSASQFPPAPPPPGMNDPGVKATPPPAPKAAPAPKSSAGKSASGNVSADTEATLSAPETSTPATSGAQPRDANGNAPPQVKVHTEGDQTIQEYSRSGQVYMVVVTPKGGIPQTYLIDQKGAWTNQAGEPIKPVMYKVMEWGKSKSAEDQDNGGQ